MNEPTREDDEQLVHMLHMRFREGRSYGYIADRFGLTKNTVIGKLSRMKKHIH